MQTVYIERSKMVSDNDVWVTTKVELGRPSRKLYVQMPTSRYWTNFMIDYNASAMSWKPPREHWLWKKGRIYRQQTDLIPFGTQLKCCDAYPGWNKQYIQGWWCATDVTSLFRCTVYKDVHLEKHTTTETTWESLLVRVWTQQRLWKTDNIKKPLLRTRAPWWSVLNTMQWT